jgi:hypothetical protein
MAWLLQPGDGSVEVRRRTIELVRAQDHPTASGEYKRHQVYARLIKEFPAEKHRTLGLEIELALQEINV